MKLNRIIAMLVIAVIAPILFFAGCEAADDSKEARLVYVNWEEGIAWTHLAQTILEDEMGYDVTITAADVGPAFSSVASGDYDAFMEAWLPGLHANYVNQYEGDLEIVGTIYHDGVTGLIVPQYMYDDGVTSISDLARPEVVEKLGGVITGIDAGAGMMITTEEGIIPSYGLDEAGISLMASSDAAMMAAIDAAIRNEEYIVGMGWQPHSMFGYFDLVILEQDQEVFFDLDDIEIIGRTGLAEDKPELHQFLNNMYFTNETIGPLMVHINESNLSTLEAAREWKDQNREIWENWIP